MDTKQTELTAHQRELLENLENFWKDHITSCNVVTDLERARKQVKWLYNACGVENDYVKDLQSGPIVVTFSSPMACRIAAEVLAQLYGNQAIIKDIIGILDKSSGSKSIKDGVLMPFLDVAFSTSISDVIDQSVLAATRKELENQFIPQLVEILEGITTDIEASVNAVLSDSQLAVANDSIYGVPDNPEAIDLVNRKVIDDYIIFAGTTARNRLNGLAHERILIRVAATMAREFNGNNIPEFSHYGNIGCAGWLTCFEFYHRIGELQEITFAKFKHFLSTGIYDMIQMRGVALVSALPNKLSFNRNGNLHNAEGPAIQFRDGYEQYYWNDVSVPKFWIENPEKVTRETIILEINAERRRCLREIIGTKQYAELLDLVELDRDHVNNQDVILYKTVEPDEVAEAHLFFVKVTCHSTGREYFICVPESAATNAWAAVAWTFSKTEQEYKPVLET